jgi:hypothetical protein
MSSSEVAVKSGDDPEKSDHPGEDSLYKSDSEAGDNEEKLTHNENDDPGRDEVEWMDDGHQHDLESQKSRVSYLTLTINKL